MMRISRSIFIFWGSARTSLHDLQLKKRFIYFILALYAAPQFSLCLKQASFSSCFFKALLRDFCRLRRHCKQTIVVGFHFISLLFHFLYSKCQLLQYVCTC